MGDMGDVFRSYRQAIRERRCQNAEYNAGQLLADGDNVWVRHCETHWSTTLNGNRLDYWPSRCKWRWRGKTYTGDVFGFISNRKDKSHEDNLEAKSE